MSRRNKKAFGGTRQLSAWLRLQVTFLSLSLEEFDFIPAKLLQSLITVSSPIFSLSSDAWIKSKAPGRNRGHVSQHNRWLQVLYFEGVTLATILTVSHNGLHFMSPSQEAHWSAEKRTQCSATETPQWWISLESGKRDYSQKQTKLNRHADLIQLMRGRESWFFTCASPERI